MLEKPDVQDEKIRSCLRDDFGLHIIQVKFLPLGADSNTAMYRVVAKNGTPYFLKLRRGIFDETSVTLPKLLSEQGVREVISPLGNKTGKLWAELPPFKLILYPFVEGRNGYEVDLSDDHWREFGTALKKIHTAQIPSALRGHIQRETYSSQWRESVKTFMERIRHETFDDPSAAELSAFLNLNRKETLDLVHRAASLAQSLQAEPPKFVLCHSDLHAGNILIDASGAFYIVDWDNPILAPKERDLMFVGGAQGFKGHTAQEEENLFYRAYGQTQVNSSALAYYRCERIVQDIAAYCEQLFLTNKGGEDREQALHYLKSNFLPNGTIAAAYQTGRVKLTH